MGFIENDSERKAAIRNGWLDERGRVTTDGARAMRLLRSNCNPNRRVQDMLTELRLLILGEES